MKRVFRAASLIQVAHARNVLLTAGIQSELRNQYLAGALGDLPMLETWPQLFVEDAEPESRLEEDVVTAVGERRNADNLAQTSDAVDIGIAIVILFPIALEQRHSDQTLVADRVAHHLAVARLEDMQGKLELRKKHYIGKRKNGD